MLYSFAEDSLPQQDYINELHECKTRFKKAVARMRRLEDENRCLQQLLDDALAFVPEGALEYLGAVRLDANY
jgi:predicted KAP-like P-loop ATPase